MSKEAELSVGEVAKRTGVAVSALHFYESKDLIKSHRNNSNHRRYHRTVLRKIAVIKAAQQAGMPLKIIAQQLACIPNSDAVSPQDWQVLSKAWQADLDDRIERLTLLRDNLNYCIGCGCLSEKNCQLVNAHDKFSRQGTGAHLLQPENLHTFIKEGNQE